MWTFTEMNRHKNNSNPFTVLSVFNAIECFFRGKKDKKRNDLFSETF